MYLETQKTCQNLEFISNLFILISEGYNPLTIKVNRRLDPKLTDGNPNDLSLSRHDQAIVMHSFLGCPLNRNLAARLDAVPQVEVDQILIRYSSIF